MTATIHELTSGRWFADLEIDTERPPIGQIKIGFGSGVALYGAIARADVFAGKVRARVVGGVDGLGSTIPARSYRQTTFGVILNDLAADTGESILVSDELRASYTQRWHRSQGTGASALRAITAHLGATWRHMRNGQLWIGVDTWPELVPDAVELERDDGEGWVIYSPNGPPTIEPGYTIDTRRIDSVVTTLRSGSLVQRVFLRKNSSQSVLGRLREGLGGFIDALLGRSPSSPARWDHLALYPCTVDAQAGDGTLDLRPDDAVMSGSGLSGIPLKTGLPGWEVSVSSGTRVLLGFEGGDPSRPYAALWEHDGDVDELAFDGGSLSVARVSDLVDGGGLAVIRSAGPGTPIIDVTYRPAGSFTPVNIVDSPGETPTLGLIQTGNSKLKA